MSQSTVGKRLQSLDILRGLDLFMLTFFQPVFMAFAGRWGDGSVNSFFIKQFTHVDWEGFAPWDMVMPLFLFMVGAAMPFSLARYIGESYKSIVYKRIAKRFVILFVLGMVVQGNLLNLNVLAVRVYTNTLQAIAVGYLFSALILLNFSRRWQIGATVILLVGFWALITFLGDFTPAGNIAEKIDRIVLGRFRDGVWYDEAGNWHFSDFYNYTWILSSMTFIVTTMLGAFAGQIMKEGKDKLKNSKYLFFIGLALLLGGWLLSFQTPVIKKIWSASMTLWSGGWCFILMALFYYVVDYKGWSSGLNWLKIYGMNSITAYVLAEVVNFRGVVHSLIFGLEQYAGDYYGALLTLGNFLILFFILRLMYKLKFFVKI